MRQVLTAALMLAAYPAFAQTLAFTPAGSIAGPADLVEAAGTQLYVAGGKTLTIYDVGTAAAPMPLGTFTFPDLIWNMAAVDSTLYLAIDTSGLAILDVSKPGTPVLRGSIKTPGQAKAVALSGSRAYVADHVRGIDVIDLSSPAKPVLMTSLFVDGFAKDVFVRGTSLYTLDQPNGLNVFDLASPTLTDSVGRLTLKVPIQLRSQMEVSDSPSPRLAIVAGGGPLQIHDVSDARAPRHVTIVKTPGNAQRIAIQGNRVYVADGPAGLTVLDVTNPAAPAVAGGFKMAGPARDVAVAGSSVFVVAGAGVVILSEQR